MNKKVYIDTLGCAKNEVDSQVLAANLLKKGFVLTGDPEEAGILIVNTCGFIEAAKAESISRIFELAAVKGEEKKLVVTGCLAERYHEELAKEMPEADIFAGVNDYDALPDLLWDGSAGGDCVAGDPGDILPYEERLFPEGA